MGVSAWICDFGDIRLNGVHMYACVRVNTTVLKLCVLTFSGRLLLVCACQRVFVRVREHSCVCDR